MSILQSTEISILKNSLRDLLDKEEEAYDPTKDQPPNLNFIRLRFVHFKFNKIVGAFENIEVKDKLELVNSIMQTYLWSNGKMLELNDVDKKSMDDIAIIAAEIMNGIKIYEWSILNPINYILLTILELAVKKSPKNVSLRFWMLKILNKLGLSTMFTNVQRKGFDDLGEIDREKFNAFKFSHF